MLINSKKLKGLAIHATDGDLGSVDQFYFDDESWEVRYLIVDTGGWLGGRLVLISPQSVISTDWENGKLNVALSKAQVENSPTVDTHKPVSRQHEVEYLGYYGFPLYWQGAGMLVPDSMPALDAVLPPGTELIPEELDLQDSHLRSTEEVSGYYLEAADGELGHVAEFIVDAQAWVIRYIEVATQNWWPGKKVLVSPAWVEQVSWNRSKVHVALSQRAIQEAPEYDADREITRDYESRLFAHYGRANYWLP